MPHASQLTDHSARRVMMVDTQVRPSDVTRFPVISAMLAVRRERFVPAALREAAYMGENLHLAPGRVGGHDIGDQAGEAGAELRGVHVRVDQVWAGSAPNLSERALVLVRLALRGPEAARQGWAGCDISLRDAADRVWLPLISADSEGAVRVLSPDGESKGRCNPIPYDAPPDGQEFLSDQLFLVPSELLKGARLRVSA